MAAWALPRGRRGGRGRARGSHRRQAAALRRGHHPRLPIAHLAEPVAVRAADSLDLDDRAALDRLEDDGGLRRHHPDSVETRDDGQGDPTLRVHALPEEQVLAQVLDGEVVLDLLAHRGEDLLLRGTRRYRAPAANLLRGIVHAVHGRASLGTARDVVPSHRGVEPGVLLGLEAAPASAPAAPASAAANLKAELLSRGVSARLAAPPAKLATPPGRLARRARPPASPAAAAAAALRSIAGLAVVGVPGAVVLPGADGFLVGGVGGVCARARGCVLLAASFFLPPPSPPAPPATSSAPGGGPGGTGGGSAGFLLGSLASPRVGQVGGVIGASFRAGTPHAFRAGASCVASRSDRLGPPAGSTGSFPASTFSAFSLDALAPEAASASAVAADDDGGDDFAIGRTTVGGRRRVSALRRLGLDDRRPGRVHRPGRGHGRALHLVRGREGVEGRFARSERDAGRVFGRPRVSRRMSREGYQGGSRHGKKVFS